MEVTLLRDHPEKTADAAEWFHCNWGIPKEEYLESMAECVKNKCAVPQWYIIEENGKIIAGMGVIENDFHNRKDLAPNVCAVYVESSHRCRGIAGYLLNFVCEDMHSKGIDVLYLVTSHNGFYERYGWEHFCNVSEDNGTISNCTGIFINKFQTCPEKIITGQVCLHSAYCQNNYSRLTNQGECGNIIDVSV